LKLVETATAAAMPTRCSESSALKAAQPGQQCASVGATVCTSWATVCTSLLLPLLQTSQDVADIYAKLQAIQDDEAIDDEEVAQRVQHGVSHAIEVSDVEDDTVEGQAGTQGEQLLICLHSC
jgi:hypothetical protein